MEDYVDEKAMERIITLSVLALGDVRLYVETLLIECYVKWLKMEVEWMVRRLISSNLVCCLDPLHRFP